MPDSQEPLIAADALTQPPVYDAQALLGLIYTSGTTGKPKGATMTHAAMLANIQHLNYWLPHAPGNVYLHAAPLFHIADLPFIFAAAAFGMCQVALPKFKPELFCGMVQSARVTHTVLVPTMLQLLTEFAQLEACVALKAGASLTAPELIAHCRESLAGYKIPRRIEFADGELPKSGSGKILKRLLRERFWTNQARAIG